jgi:glycosyltransferase involved in cell wall biosynthesis
VRVAYLQRELPSLTETFVTTELTLLERRGLEVLPFSVFPPTFPGALDDDARAWVPRTQRPAPRDMLALVPSGLKAFRVAARGGERSAVSVGGWLGLPFAAAVARAIRRCGATHVHTHFAGGSAHLARLASRIARVPFSITAHAYDVYSVPAARARPLRDRLEAAAFVRASHGALADAISAIAPGARVLVVPTPLDLADPRLAWRAPPAPRATLRLVTVARLVPKKGLDLLPRLVAALRRRGVRSHVTHIGPGDPRCIGGAGITCLGPRPRGEVLARIRDADVMVLPCRIASDGDRDGVPYALLEALAIGVPCVTTTVAGLPELFSGSLASGLVAPNDVEGMAERVALLAQDAPARGAASREGRVRVEAAYGETCTARLAALFGGN